MLEMLLAVSGGVDSMVMLDLVWHQTMPKNTPNELTVAHVNHGMRPSAKEDADFVTQVVTEKYRLCCFGADLRLGEQTSEEVARKGRYEYLRELAYGLTPAQEATLTAHEPGKPKIGQEMPRVKICTAHHLDDLVETVAINFVRGTGWRGLACLDAPGIRRPLLEAGENLPMDRKAILRYAAEHEITFREDPTNNSSDYLRNRIRFELKKPEKALTLAQKMQLWQLWQRQKELKKQIEETVASLIPLYGEAWQRSWFENLEPNLAIELLKAGVEGIGVSATRPQLENFRQAILHYAPGKYFNLPGGKLVKLTKTEFRLA